MTKRITEHIIIALAIGFVCTTACLWFFGAYNESGLTIMRQFTTWLAASILYGLISLIYDSNIRFPFSLIIHFLSCSAVTFIASIVSGLFEIMQWYEWFIYVMPVFVAIYVIICIVSVIVSRHQAKKINNKVKSNQTQKGH